MSPDLTRKIRLIMSLRAQGIYDTDVLSAMETIPREIFIPEHMHDQAYEDRALPIARGQTISQPYVVAYMTQCLGLTSKTKVLEIGTGSGYQASILAKLCRRVYTIERHKPLLIAAQHIFDELKLRNITAICGDGMKGWPMQAPFDRIIVTAAAQQDIPRDLLDQISLGGHMIIPVGKMGAQNLVKVTRVSEKEFVQEKVMPVRFVPLLPDIARDSEDVVDESYLEEALA